MIELENPIDETIWIEVRGRGQQLLLCAAYRSQFSDFDFWTRLSLVSSQITLFEL